MVAHYIDLHSFICIFSVYYEVRECVLTWWCLTLCDPMDCSPPGSSVHGILQARVLEWIAISFSRGSSWPRDWIRVSCIGRRVLYHWATSKVPLITMSRSHFKGKQGCHTSINSQTYMSKITYVYKSKSPFRLQLISTQCQYEPAPDQVGVCVYLGLMSLFDTVFYQR